MLKFLVRESMTRGDETFASGRWRLVDVADRTRSARHENWRELVVECVVSAPETLFNLTLTWHEDFLVEVRQKERICHMTDTRFWRSEG